MHASHLALFERPNVDDVRSYLLTQCASWADRGRPARAWRAHGHDTALRECWQARVVLAGESPGSLCWHRRVLQEVPDDTPADAPAHSI